MGIEKTNIPTANSSVLLATVNANNITNASAVCVKSHCFHDQRNFTSQRLCNRSDINWPYFALSITPNGTTIAKLAKAIASST
jgi:hypothetical protein